jgi:hypothetical protein
MTQSNNVIEFPFHGDGFTPAQNSEQLLVPGEQENLYQSRRGSL